MALPPSGRISTRTRRRKTAAPGSVQFAVDYDFGSGRAPWPSFSLVDPPPLVRYTPSTTLGCHPGSTSAPNACPDGIHPV